MSNNLPIDTLLQQISLEEGEGFVYNRDKIITDLQEQRAVFSNWGISLLSIIGGLVAAVLFTGFMLLAGLYESATGLLIVGFILIAGSVWINKAVKNLLLDTATIGLYIAGFCMMAAGLFLSKNTSSNMVISTCLLIAAGVIIISDSAMLVFISVLIFNGSLMSYIIFNEVYNAIHLFIAFATAAYTFISLNETHFISKTAAVNARYNPIRTGFLLSLIAAMVIITESATYEIQISQVYFSSVILMAAVLFTVYKITQSLHITQSVVLIPIYIISFLILMPTLFAPAIAGSLLILVIGFYNGYRMGFVMGIVALIYFVSRYYYDLHLSLLTKSIVLMASGLLFIVLFFALQKKLLTNE